MRQRLLFIGRRLLDVGTVNRADLVAEFGISAVQASADFRSYEREQPGVMTYDVHRKAYVPATAREHSSPRQVVGASPGETQND